MLIPKGDSETYTYFDTKSSKLLTSQRHPTLTTGMPYSMSKNRDGLQGR